MRIRRTTKRRNSRHDTETDFSVGRSRALNPHALTPRPGTVGTARAGLTFLECDTAEREGRGGAGAEEQSGNLCRPADCIGFRAGDARSAFESMAASLRQPD